MFSVFFQLITIVIVLTIKCRLKPIYYSYFTMQLLENLHTRNQIFTVENDYLNRHFTLDRKSSTKIIKFTK